MGLCYAFQRCPDIWIYNLPRLVALSPTKFVPVFLRRGRGEEGGRARRARYPRLPTMEAINMQIDQEYLRIGVITCSGDVGFGADALDAHDLCPQAEFAAPQSAPRRGKFAFVI